jgi:hypothetical protein
MPSWRNANSRRRLCSGRLLRRVLFAVLSSAGLCSSGFTPLPAVVTVAAAQTSTNPKPAAKKAAAHRANEMTLAGLRPGRDSLARAAQLNRQFGAAKTQPGNQTVWLDACRDLSLTIDGSEEKRAEVIRVGTYAGSTADCLVTQPSPWKTGLGLRVGDPTSKLAQIYGPADSKSPSTRDGQPLELWYYAFDWAGPDVPQVMEVLCTREKDGQPGRVIEITLAAPSL